jgi:hypothetical protein
MFRLSMLSKGVLLGLFALPLGSRTAKAAETWVSCTPVRVVTYQARVHVQCATPIGGVTYFALSTQDSAFAARVLSIIATASVAHRTLTILYEPTDLSGAAIGCQNTDCRLIRGIGL